MNSDFSPAQNERVKAALRALLARQPYAGNQTRLAEALGIRPASLNRMLNHTGGASWKTARRLAELTAKTLDELLGPEGPLPGEPTPAPRTRVGDVYPKRSEVLTRLADLFAPDVLEYVTKRKFYSHPETMSELQWIAELLDEQQWFTRMGAPAYRDVRLTPEKQRSAGERAELVVAEQRSGRRQGPRGASR